jgi:hypothetical protein
LVTQNTASNQVADRLLGGIAGMDTTKWIIATAPEIFLLLSIAIGVPCRK